MCGALFIILLCCIIHVFADDSCRNAGFTDGCCTEGLSACAVLGSSDIFCFCDCDCFATDTCCTDIHEINCFPKSCAEAGKLNCVITPDEACEVQVNAYSYCYCDRSCSSSQDCCPPTDLEATCLQRPGVIPVSVPGSVTDLECPNSRDGGVLHIYWKSQGNNINDDISYTYTVVIQEYIQDLTEMLRPSNTSFNLEVQVADEEVTVNVASGVEMYVPYRVSVTLAGSNSAALIVCFTEEGVPTASPSFVVTSNQSSIVVTWERLTLLEARGFIEYLIHLYEESSVERQSMQLPMSEDSATFTGLEKCTRYEVSMSTRTRSSGATGPVSERKAVPLDPSCSPGLGIEVVVAVVVMAVVLACLLSFTLFIVIKLNFKSTLASHDQEEPHAMSELIQQDNTTTTTGQGLTHEESITASQEEQHSMPELGQHHSTTTTRGQGSEFMTTSPEEPLALSTITITPGDVPTMPKLICFPSSNGNINLAEEIGGDYFNFGTLLLDDNKGKKVSAIERELMRNAEDINSRIFTLWLKGKGKQPVTWSTLANVLQDIGHNNLAKSIIKSY